MAEITTSCVKGNVIYIVRGDYFAIPVTITLNGKPYELGKLDCIHTQCRMRGNRNFIVWDKYLDPHDQVLVIEPHDTEGLDANAKYVYDIQLESANGYVQTIIPESPLVVLNDVTSRYCGCYHGN